MDKNPLKSAKVVAVEADASTYHRHSVARGEPGFTMSRSQLAVFNANPVKWKNGYEPSESKAMDWGSLVDVLALTPDHFDRRYAVTPSHYPATPKRKDASPEMKPWTGRATYCAEWETTQEAEGRQIVQHKDHVRVKEAVSVLTRNPEVTELFECSKKQVVISAEYFDRDTGLLVPLKMMLDLLPTPSHHKFGKCIADLKTVDCAAPRLWRKHVRQYWLDVQAALYLDAYTLATGEDRCEFRHVIQESCFPYDVSLRFLSEEFINQGRALYVKALRRYARCVALKQWPGYDENARLTVGPWAITEPEPWMAEDAIL